MDKGLFITFEGGEGSGKTTQINRLSKTLSNLPGAVPDHGGHRGRRHARPHRPAGAAGRHRGAHGPRRRRGRHEGGPGRGRRGRHRGAQVGERPHRDAAHCPRGPRRGGGQGRRARRVGPRHGLRLRGHARPRDGAHRGRCPGELHRRPPLAAPAVPRDALPELNLEPLPTARDSMASLGGGVGRGTDLRSARPAPGAVWNGSSIHAFVRRASAPGGALHLGVAAPGDHELAATILRPGALVAGAVQGPLLSVADDLDPAVGDALGLHVPGHRVGPLLAQGDVVVGGAALIGVALDLDADVGGLLHDDHVVVEGGLAVGRQARGVELEEHALEVLHHLLHLLAGLRLGRLGLGFTDGGGLERSLGRLLLAADPDDKGETEQKSGSGAGHGTPLELAGRTPESRGFVPPVSRRIPDDVRVA